MTTIFLSSVLAKKNYNNNTIRIILLELYYCKKKAYSCVNIIECSIGRGIRPTKLSKDSQLHHPFTNMAMGCRGQPKPKEHNSLYTVIFNIYSKLVDYRA